jgi:hypothetical protein
MDHLLWGAVGVALLAGPSSGCRTATDPPDPPQGGGRLALDYARFQSEVLPVLERHGCDAGGDCHGGGIRGTYELSPREAKDPAHDFEQTRLQVWAYDRSASPLLTKPLADSAGGAPHSVKVFASREDEDFRVMADWIDDAPLVEGAENR